MVKDATSAPRVQPGGGVVIEGGPQNPQIVEDKPVGFSDSDKWVAPRRDRRERGDARAQLRRVVVSSGLALVMNQSLKKGGSEFSHSRQYNQGDEGRHIDWKASARTQKLHTKTFTEDPDPAVVMIIPTKHWGKATIHERERRRHFEQIAALLGFSAEQNKTPFGVMVYSDKTDLFAIGDGTPSSTDSLLDRLGALESPGNKSYRPEKGSLVDAELKSLRGRSAVIFYCTDRPDDPIPPEVLALGKKHELVRLTVTPDRISTSQPAMLRIAGSAFGGNYSSQSRRKTAGVFDELIAQRLLDRQPVETDETTTLTMSVGEPFDRQLVDFFRRPK